MNKLNETSVQFVKGVGPVKKKLFSNLGIESVEDLLYYFPRHYQDRREIISLAQVKIGEYQTITGLVLSCKSRRSYYTKKHVTEVVLDDKSGRIFLTWFNQPYLDHYFRKDVRVVCYGKVDMYKDRIQMVSPEYEVIEGNGPMHRLLQGDVGSGKTLVAIFGCFLSFKAGHQSCIMAPTEILARQHYENIESMVDSGTLKGMRVELLVSAMKKNEKEEVCRKISAGEVDLVLGTHSLISEDVNF